jgi:hypothetical protein
MTLKISYSKSYNDNNRHLQYFNVQNKGLNQYKNGQQLAENDVTARLITKAIL